MFRSEYHAGVICLLPCHSACIWRLSGLGWHGIFQRQPRLGIISRCGSSCKSAFSAFIVSRATRHIISAKPRTTKLMKCPERWTRVIGDNRASASILFFAIGAIRARAGPLALLFFRWRPILKSIAVSVLITHASLGGAGRRIAGDCFQTPWAARWLNARMPGAVCGARGHLAIMPGGKTEEEAQCEKKRRCGELQTLSNGHVRPTVQTVPENEYRSGKTCAGH